MTYDLFYENKSILTYEQLCKIFRSGSFIQIHYKSDVS